jgi:curved DNA-binding protein CbpA
MPQHEENPYLVLGLESGAGTDAIKQAYFSQVRAHPPEREPAAFKRFRSAYEQLRDPVKRAELDMLLPAAWSPPSRQRRTPQLDLSLHREDVLAAAESLTDLHRTQWNEYQRKVKL